jgi:hypothetical protein
VLVECTADKADAVGRRVGEIMRLASAALLAGEAIDVDVAIVKHPDRYCDEGAAEMWSWLMEELRTAENTNQLRPEQPKRQMEEFSPQLSFEEQADGLALRRRQ